MHVWGLSCHGDGWDHLKWITKAIKPTWWTHEEMAAIQFHVRKFSNFYLFYSFRKQYNSLEPVGFLCVLYWSHALLSWHNGGCLITILWVQVSMIPSAVDRYINLFLLFAVPYIYIWQRDPIDITMVQIKKRT